MRLIPPGSISPAHNGSPQQSAAAQPAQQPAQQPAARPARQPAQRPTQQPAIARPGCSHLLTAASLISPARLPGTFWLLQAVQPARPILAASIKPSRPAHSPCLDQPSQQRHPAAVCSSPACAAAHSVTSSPTRTAGRAASRAAACSLCCSQRGGTADLRHSFGQQPPAACACSQQPASQPAQQPAQQPAACAAAHSSLHSSPQ